MTGTPPSTEAALLALEDLQTYFETDEGLARAVDGVSFTIRSGRTLGLVGESGCGKSVTALSILRLVPSPPGRIVAGRVLFEGRDLLALGDEELRRVRGAAIAMIFQEPMTSLNPVFTVGYQIGEALRAHRRVSRRETRERTLELLEMVGIPAPRQRTRSYPHELSGGMRQRVMIAMALACKPRLLIADEPTTALDVTIQSQILEFLAELQERLDMAVLLITHDLAVIAENTHDVVVMYAGRVVEEAPVARLFEQPLHPYTRSLFRSVPRLDGPLTRLETIPGMVPSAVQFPAVGCRYAARCALAEERCVREDPAPRVIEAGHRVACHVV